MVAQLRPKNLVPLAHVEHGWVIGNSLALFGEDVGDVVQIPLDELDRYYTPPFAIAIAPDKSMAYVSTTGSDSVTVIDVAHLLAFMRGISGAGAPDAGERSLGFRQLCRGAHSGGPRTQGSGALARRPAALRGQPHRTTHFDHRHGRNAASPARFRWADPRH